MGGDYYDRPVIAASTTSAYGNDVVGRETRLNKSLDPKSYITGDLECVSDAGNPIVFALDVTGSMGEWPKIIYDKLPMFYGQIMQHSYLQDPALSFCAVGDAICDDAPLQVSRFGQGRQIDELISKIWLEGGGGGNQHESYELAAYFYNHYCKCVNSDMAFFFVTGDEGYFDNPKVNHYNKVLGEKPHGQLVDALAEWKVLMKKYNVFHIKKEYDNKNHEVKIYQQWVNALGKERVLKIQTPKACIDVILGAIALTSGATDLPGYIKDMEERGQSKERIEEVTAALHDYAEAIKNKRIAVVATKKLVEEASEHYAKHKKEGEEAPNKYREDLRKMKEAFSGDIPSTFFCPITGEIFIDPVMTSDGQTYERSAIVAWLENHNTSPLTGLNLESKHLMPNIIIKKLINEFHDKKMSKK